MENEQSYYPEFLNNLPDIESVFKGVSGKLLQGKDSQLVFMEIDAIGDVPPHSHGAQWGVVLKGEMKLTIDGVENIYKKGDSYYIPSGVVHSAIFNSKVFLIDYFDDKGRYEVEK